MVRFEIQTPDLPDAGGDATLVACLHDSQGRSSEFELLASNKKFERGRRDEFTAEMAALGDLESVELLLKGGTWWPGRITVTCDAGLSSARRWTSVPDDDKPNLAIDSSAVAVAATRKMPAVKRFRKVLLGRQSFHAKMQPASAHGTRMPAAAGSAEQRVVLRLRRAQEYQIKVRTSADDDGMSFEPGQPNAAADSVCLPRDGSAIHSQVWIHGTRSRHARHARSSRDVFAVPPRNMRQSVAWLQRLWRMSLQNMSVNTSVYICKYRCTCPCLHIHVYVYT